MAVTEVEYNQVAWTIDRVNDKYARLYPMYGNYRAPIVVARYAVVPVNGGDDR